jgi:hypothetical protein
MPIPQALYSVTYDTVGLQDIIVPNDIYARGGRHTINGKMYIAFEDDGLLDITYIPYKKVDGTQSEFVQSKDSSDITKDMNNIEFYCNDILFIQINIKRLTSGSVTISFLDATYSI